MSELDHQLAIKQPVNVFNKPLSADWKAFFKALSAVAGNAVQGKWVDAGTKAVESLCALGLATQPEELAFLLVRRSLLKAMFELLGESVSLQLQPKDAETVVAGLDFSAALLDARIGREFLEHPSQLPLLDDLQPLLRAWLEKHDIPSHSAQAIAGRLPSYFVYALNEEWHRHRSTYQPLLEALDTPFARAGELEWRWTQYAALLTRRVQESLFDEPFSLSQIYVPLNAYYEEFGQDRTGTDSATRARKRVVVAVERELHDWLDQAQPSSAIRVISGGPGSGKSSLLRVFASEVSRRGKFKVLFVPLHLIDASQDLVEEVGRFVREEGVLTHNPLAPESKERNLLVVFDGLDELAAQGRAAAEIARAFLREVERTVERRNVQSVRLRVVVSGRELVVQENEMEFRRPRQILTLLPYLKSSSRDGAFDYGERYEDPENLLQADLRTTWWQNYGQLTGKNYDGLPAQLARDDLTEITAQPLLNYLVALSVVRGKLNFDQEVNLNSIYADLVAAVHERGYEKYGAHRSIRHMKLEDFERVLEEIGLATWHGDGRTTTIAEIENYCRSNGLGKQLDAFRVGAEAGVTRLLAAFFFRQYGQRASGDPTFVFTHKSFGEYLAARRVVRAIGRMIRELEAHEQEPDGGWDEREALKHWATLCGPSPMTAYLQIFIGNEIALRPGPVLENWQTRLTQLLNYTVRHGLPIEQLGLKTFKEMQVQSGNAEETLLAAVHECAMRNQCQIEMVFVDPHAFADWYRRLPNLGSGAYSSLASQCLTRMNLQACDLVGMEFIDASLELTDLRNSNASFANFCYAFMPEANLTGAHFPRASFFKAHLANAQLTAVTAPDCNFTGAVLANANLSDADLRRTNLTNADLSGANLTDTLVTEAILRGANFDGAILKGATFDLEARKYLESQQVDLTDVKFLDPQNQTETM